MGAHYYLELRELLQEKPDVPRDDQAEDAITREDYIKIVERTAECFLAGVERNIGPAQAVGFHLGKGIEIGPKIHDAFQDAAQDSVLPQVTLANQGILQRFVAALRGGVDPPADLRSTLPAVGEANSLTATPGSLTGVNGSVRASCPQ